MYIESTNKQAVFKGDEDGHKLLKLIDDMGWDYDRFSSSGQETYDKICTILAPVLSATLSLAEVGRPLVCFPAIPRIIHHRH